ncbi:hypothetical protein B0H10DRAFT_1414532 [Mycena sp. CBHHK59/15]|nr:hypothetical protein B0H10DRAFT_1414532 [Mycena sp. CBHHK59/15]
MNGGDTEANDTEGQDAMVVEQYESFKAMGSADHAQAVAKVSRSNSTADIKTVFRRVKCHKNPATGVLEDGAICLVRTGVSASACFLTGSVRSLHNHSAHQTSHECHFKVYQAHCRELGIEPHHRAIPRSASSKGIQVTLDACVVSEPRPPAFTPEGLRDFLIEMIVTQDEVFLYYFHYHANTYQRQGNCG